MGGHILALGLVSLLALFIYQGKAHTIKKNAFFITAAELICFFFIAFRATSVGLDTHTYEFYFTISQSSSSYYLNLGWEPLYLLITRVALLFHSFRIVLIICAAITCIGFGYFAYRMTAAYHQCAYWFFFFYITLNLYFNSMHLLRQMCAIAITINIYPILLHERTKKAYIKSGVLLFLGIMFHYVSVLAILFFVPFFIKTNDRRSVKRFICFSALLIPFYTVGQTIMLNIPRFKRYIGDDRLSESRAGIYSIIFILVKILLIYFTLLFSPQKKKRRDLYRMTYLIIISTVFYILQFFSQFALRIGYYFEVFMLLYIPEVISHFTLKRTRRILYCLFFLFGLTYFFYMISGAGGRGSNRGTVPYSFFWQTP